MDDFATYASQECNDMFISIKFKNKNLYWTELNCNEKGPWIIGTDQGSCCYFSPHLNMGQMDPPVNADKLSIKMKEVEDEGKAEHGELNGLDIILDTEQFDYGFHHESIDSNGAGFRITLHHHMDKPMVQFSSQLIHPGRETHINVMPQVTYTTNDSINGLTHEERGCYAEDEVKLSYLLSRLGYHYNIDNCLLNEGIRGL